MFLPIYMFFIITAYLCLLAKFAYHLYKKLNPFPNTSFNIPGTRGFLSILYGFAPLKYIPDDPEENKIRRVLNYGLLYFYSIVIVLIIGDSHFSKMLHEKTSKQPVIIVDSSSLIKPVSDSEKSSTKDSIYKELKKPTL
jgi:hypothetical protein